MTDLVATIQAIHRRISALEAHLGAPGDRHGQYVGVIQEFKDRYSGKNPGHKFMIVPEDTNICIKVIAKSSISNTKLAVILTPDERVARHLIMEGTKNQKPVSSQQGMNCENMAKLLDENID
jgi:hypothetical protein